ncbi:MAG: glycosyltransferase family 4 protein [Acetobacteraceae bacterium]
MRLLYLCLDRGIPVLGDKGASVHVRAFTAAAAALGHDVTLICASTGAGNPPPPVRLIALPPPSDPALLAGEAAARGRHPGLLDDPAARRDLAKLAHDRALPRQLLTALDRAGVRPDLIYERHALFHTAGVALARALGVPRILEVNAPLVDEQRRFRGLALEADAMAAEADSYRGADAVVAVSAGVAAQVRQVLGGRHPRVAVLQNGVDLANFRPDSRRAEMRAMLGLGDAPTLGFFGSFKPWHGVGFLAGVFADIAALRPEARLIAVGEGPEHAAFAATLAAAGLSRRVILPGRVPHREVPDWLAATDLTVAPYLPQPDFYFSPLKVVESLAAGRPVVAAAMGALGQMIVPGETGLLFPPGDHAGCRAALLDLLDNPQRRAAMGRAARAAAAGWGWDQVVARALALAAPRATAA